MKRLLNDRLVLSAVIFSLLGLLFSLSVGNTMERLISYVIFFLPGYVVLRLIKKYFKEKLGAFGAAALAIVYAFAISTIISLITQLHFDMAAMITLGCVSYRVFSVNDFLKEEAHGRVLS